MWFSFQEMYHGCDTRISRLSMVAAYLIMFGVNGPWTNINLNYWLSVFKGEIVHVPLWLSYVIVGSLNLGWIGINALMEIAKYAR